MMEALETVTFPLAVFLIAKGVIPRHVRPIGHGDPRPEYLFHTEDIAAHKTAFRRALTLLKPEGNPQDTPARSLTNASPDTR